MILSDLSIRRPVLATVVNLIIVLVGLIAWDRLTIREFPNVDDAGRDDHDQLSRRERRDHRIAGDEAARRRHFRHRRHRLHQFDQPRRAVADIGALRTGRDPDAAANDVRDRVARARSFLPKEIDNPIVAKVESDATPIIYMAINSDRHNEMELTDYADRVVKDRLEVLPGVAQMLIMGERRYLDARVARSRRGSPLIADAARRRTRIAPSRTSKFPAGRIESSDREFTVLSETDLKTPAQFSQIILKDAGGYLVRLGDVANVEVGPATRAQHVARVGSSRDRTRASSSSPPRTCSTSRENCATNSSR